MLIMGEAVIPGGPLRRTVLMPFRIANSIPNAAGRDNGEGVCVNLATTCRA
jgi:hypothetical protein